MSFLPIKTKVMNKKLTREQADWLIKQFNRLDDSVIRPNRNPHDPYASGFQFAFNSLIEIINQCTEGILDIEEKSLEAHAKAFKTAVETFPE